MSSKQVRNDDFASIETAVDIAGSGGVHIVSPHGPGRGAHFITVPCASGDGVPTVVRRAMDAVRDTGASIVSMEILGLPMKGGLDVVRRITGPITWPLTWIAGPGAGRAGGVQIWADSDASVSPVQLDGHVVGSLVESADASICRLGGVNGRIPTRTPVEQTQAVLHQLEDGLHAAEMDFSNTLRTWFYNCDIVSWYKDFNHTRDSFFSEHGVYDGLLPASTGIGACNITESSVVGGLIAVKPKNDAVTMAEIPSPLQCAATDYGSSFSRAVEINTPAYRQVLVSGTASIEPHGETIHDHDVDAQIRVTMDVVKAILHSRGMDWTNVTRAIAYHKNADDIPCFDQYREDNDLVGLPVVNMTAEVCRDNLLFEIEVDAVKAAT